MLKLISKGFKIEGIVILEYTIEDNRRGHISLRIRLFYVLEFSSDLRLVSPQWIKSVYGIMGTFHAHINTAEPEIYVDLEIKEDQTGCKSKPPI